MNHLKSKFVVAAQDTWAGCKKKPASGFIGTAAATILTTLAVLNVTMGNPAAGLLPLALSAFVVKKFHDDGRKDRLKNNPPGPGANGPQ